MAKSAIKELIIVLLLALAIILLLGIVLYEYSPTTKTIPNKVEYTIPAEAKAELQETEGVDEDQIVMTYEINSSDLSNYRSTQNYKPGKANPFAEVNTSVSETNTTSSGSNGAGTSTSSSGSTANGTNSSGETQNTTSGGTFFKDKGTK